MVRIYGITNCDTVKKARAWLAERGVPEVFHDFKKDGVPQVELDAWLTSVGWEVLLNRKGTTWRKLDEPDRLSVVDGSTARALMVAHSSVIKRPVVTWADGSVTVGFDEALFLRKMA